MKILVIEVVDTNGDKYRRAIVFSTDSAAESWIPQGYGVGFYHVGDGRWIFSASALGTLLELLLLDEDGKELLRVPIVSGVIQEIDMANSNLFKIRKRGE